MNRCSKTRASLALCAGLAFTALAPLLPGGAAAQTQAQTPGFVREAPKDVKPGRLAVQLPPDITIDDKADRFSPGVRIRDLNNMLVLTGALAGKTVPVVYRRDQAGLVHEVWILTEAEYARLGGAGSEGSKRFAELLALVFGARK